MFLGIGIWFFLDQTLGLHDAADQLGRSLADPPDRRRRRDPVPRGAPPGADDRTGREICSETLDLADWRRRVADLYAEVRRVSATDVPAALALWRATREALYRDHPSSPVPIDRRATFRASHFEHDPALRFEVAVVGDGVDAGAGGRPPTAPRPIDFGARPSASRIELPVSAGGTMSFTPHRPRRDPVRRRPAPARRVLDGRLRGRPVHPVPRRDERHETYAAGRYLVDAAKSADLGGDPARGTLILDFNFAYQPSCAFDPKWACPLAPPENHLDLPIRAGERLG